MALYQKGSAQAFTVLFERHKGRLYHYLYRLLGDRAQADDLFQETFLRVVRHAQDYEPTAKFTTWLFTIARNQCMDLFRRKKVRHAALGALREAAEAQGEGVAPRELGHRLAAVLAALAEEQREVFLMRELLDIPFKEIAQVTGVPESTVKSRMRYALEKLREGLGAEASIAQAVRS